MKSIVSIALLGLGFASASFAAEPLVIEYQFYSAYIADACPTEITQLVDDKEHLKLTFDTQSPDSRILLSSTTPNVSIPESATLSKEDDPYYMLNNSSKLKVGDKTFTIKQLWVANNESAFYVGDNTACLVMTSRAAESDFHSQPRDDTPSSPFS
ncbi:MAG: hypothetical protein V4496_00580 [Pseudomonadota bacterium]